MNEQDVYETLLESVAAYYNAIGSQHRLKILLALREEFIDGIKWAGLKELTRLSSGALKRHVDILIEVGLIGKSRSSYRITKSGLGVLTQVDDVIEAMKKILSGKEELEK